MTAVRARRVSVPRLGGEGLDAARYALIAVVVLAAVVRFATLGAKSYWEDEGLTVRLLHQPFGEMLHNLHSTEPDPPLYFALAWVWARVAGYGEVALRSLSALAGTLTVVVAYALGTRAVNRRTGLVAAGLLAVNPLLVWYSQEARPYALFALLGALSLWLLYRVLERPTRRRYAAWGASCAAALATHYFAVFLILPEVAWLTWPLWRGGRRTVVVWIAAFALLAVAIAFAASRQLPAAQAQWGGLATLPYRTASIPAMFFVGFEVPHRTLLAAICGCLAAISLVSLLRGAAYHRRELVVAASVGLGSVALPLGAALIGTDYLVGRNVISALVPLWIVLAAGFAAPGMRRLGLPAAGALGAVSLVVVLSTAWTPKYHSQDWRAAATALGRSPNPRAIVLAPPLGSAALAVYLPRGLRPLLDAPTPVSEIDVIATVQRANDSTDTRPAPLPPAHPPAPAPGFRLAQITHRSSFTLVRYRADRPARVSVAIAAAGAFAHAAVGVYMEPGSR